MKKILNKVGKLMTVCLATVISVFATVSVSVGPTMVHAENMLDNIKMNGAGGLETGELASSSADETFNTVYSKYKTILNGAIGLVTITLILLFVIQCAKLGAAADNANRRSSSVSALLWIGVSAGLLGAVYTFIGLFYNLFNA